MRNIYITVAVLSFLLYATCLSHAAVAPVEKLGERFQHFDEKDWPIIKSRFDELLQMNKIADLGKPRGRTDDNTFEYVCLLGRVLTIDWSPEKKQKVAEYFLKTAAEMCQKPKYLDGCSPSQKEIEKIGASAIDGYLFPCDILFLMLRVYGQFTDSPHNAELDQILKKCDYKQPEFQEKLRLVLLLAARGQIRFPETVTLLKDWESSPATWSSKNRKQIASLIRLHGYMAAETDEKAWELFWSTIKTVQDGQKINSVFSFNIDNVIEMIEARKFEDPQEIYALAIKTDSFLKKYYLINMALKVGLSEIEPEKVEKAKQIKVKMIYPIVKEMSREIQKAPKLKQLFGDFDPNRLQMESFIDLDAREKKEKPSAWRFLKKSRRKRMKKTNQPGMVLNHNPLLQSSARRIKAGISRC